MMVTAVVEASEETLAFQRIIGGLQGKQDGAAPENRTALYDSISNWFKENDAGKMTGSEIIEMRPFVTQFSTDIMSDDTRMVQAALQAMGFCLYQAGIVRALTKEDRGLVVKALCNCLLKTDDKSVCTRALWCLAKQNMKPDVLEDEVHTILCSVEKALQSEGSAKSMTVQHESVNVIIRLQEQLPDKMAAHAARWGKLLLPHLLHSAPKIRERAMYGTHLGLVAMVKCRAELGPPLTADLKGGLLTEMMKLFRGRHEMCVLKVWSYYVTILGKTLHKGGSVINNLLAVVEQGFKHPQQDIKKAAYNTWNTLIDNFSLELDVLSNAKRLKLLMQPFLATSIRYESVAHAKFDAWWHLVRALGPRLPATFQVVCAPLLQSTLGSTGVVVGGDVTPSKNASGISPALQGFSTPQSRGALLPAASPITPRLNLTSSLGSSTQQAFPSIQQRGLRMLAAFMGVKIKAENTSAPVDTLPQRLLTSPSVFSKLAPTLVPFIMDALRMQDDITGDLPLQIFEALISQVKGAVEGPSKRDGIAVFTQFMDQLTATIGTNHLPQATVLKLLDFTSQLPKKVLSSSSYHTGDAGILHGTPALFLTDLLFNQTVALRAPEERFFTILMRLVECGMSSQATVLGFTQSVLAILDKVADSINDKDALWRIWSSLAEPLLQHVIQTNEVNQGDSLEHDFSALTVCLLFPIQRLLPHNLSQPTVKTLLRLWSELYEAFARSASLVTIVEANQCCEDVCSKLLAQLGDNEVEKWNFQAALSHMCQVFTQNLDLSQYTESGVGSPAPRRKGKKRRPEGNLSSVVKLVGHVTDSCVVLCKKQASSISPSLSQTDVVHWFNAVQSIISAISDLGRVGPTSSLYAILETLGKPLGNFIRYSSSPNLAKKDYITSVEDKVERLWTEWATTLQSRYSDQFDSSFLSILAPILEATFTYKRRSVRDYTLLFWTATFGKQDALEYPDSLASCFVKLKKHCEIVLPGWKEPEIPQEKSLILETEASQSFAEPIAPALIPNFGGPSPKKFHGSFLRRTEDAKKLMVASSPVKDVLGSPVRGSKAVSPGRGLMGTGSPGRRKTFASPMVMDVAKRRLPVDEDSKVEFVVISKSASKKRVLTEHQKEVMRTKRVSLPLYNDLEQSQDTQAFKDLTQTQSQSLQPSPAISEEDTNELGISKFDFAGKLSQESLKKIEKENDKSTEIQIDQKNQEKTQKIKGFEKAADKTVGKKEQRRMVTFFQVVSKPSSPLKDAGQLDVKDDGHHGNKDEDEHYKELTNGIKDDVAYLDSSEGSKKEKENLDNSVTVIEDTCTEVASMDAISLKTSLTSASAFLIANIGDEDEVGEKQGKGEIENDSFLVPDTQDGFQNDSDDDEFADAVQDISDLTLISTQDNPEGNQTAVASVQESPVESVGESQREHTTDDMESTTIGQILSKSSKAAVTSTGESPQKNGCHDLKLMAIGESPNKNSTSEDLEDVLPDGRFKKVVSTPVVKLQKLSQEDIDVYSPKSKKSQEERSGARNTSHVREIIAEKSSKNGEESPKSISSPTDSTSGTPRFRRYKSDELHVRSATPKRTRRWNSMTEVAKSESKAGAMKMLSAAEGSQKTSDLRKLQSSQKDLAELAERYELDGIAPLGDIDQSFEDGPVATDTTATNEQANMPSANHVIDKEMAKHSENEKGPESPKRKRGRSHKGEEARSKIGGVTDSGDVPEKIAKVATHVVESTSDVGSISELQKETSDQSDLEDILGSQQELFSDTKDLNESQRSKVAEVSQLDDTQDAVVSSVQDVRRKRGRSQKSKVNEDLSSQKDLENGDGSENTCVEELEVKKRKRLRPRKSVVEEHKSHKADKAKECEDDLDQNKMQESLDSQSETLDNEADKQPPTEAAVAAEAASENVENTANVSCEDIFGTQSESIGITASQRENSCQAEEEQESHKSLDDSSYCSEDDVPLMMIKKSLESKTEMTQTVEDVEPDHPDSSEDSEIDFPAITPKCKSDKIDPYTETPPKSQQKNLSEQEEEKLSQKMEKHTNIRSPSGKSTVEPFTITRSGRKCRPSVKFRSAKGKLKKLLKSPEHRLLKSPEHKLLKSPNGKLLRSPEGKLLKSPDGKLLKSPKHKLPKSQEHKIKSPDHKALSMDSKSKRKSDVHLSKISPKVLRSSISKVLKEKQKEKNNSQQSENEKQIQRDQLQESDSQLSQSNNHSQTSTSQQSQSRIDSQKSAKNLECNESVEQYKKTQKKMESEIQLSESEKHSQNESQTVLFTMKKSHTSDLSNFAISPTSLQTLAERVGENVSPEQILEAQSKSAQKVRLTSPETSPVSSTQDLRGSKGARSAKRSKSPVSLRLRARRLCITPGPLQTRSGTRLSRGEIKKKNKIRRKQLELEDGDKDGNEDKEKNDDGQKGRNIIDSTEPGSSSSDSKSKEIKEKTSDAGMKSVIEAGDVIVIRDTMSQDVDDDDSAVQEIVENLASNSKQSIDKEVESIKLNAELESKVIKELLQEPESQSQMLDEDGDVQMKDLQDETAVEESISDAISTKPEADSSCSEKHIEAKETQNDTMEESERHPTGEECVVISDTMEDDATQADDAVNAAEVNNIENEAVANSQVVADDEHVLRNATKRQDDDGSQMKTPHLDVSENIVKDTQSKVVDKEQEITLENERGQGFENAQDFDSYQMKTRSKRSSLRLEFGNDVSISVSQSSVTTRNKPSAENVPKSLEKSEKVNRRPEKKEEVGSSTESDSGSSGSDDSDDDRGDHVEDDVGGENEKEEAVGSSTGTPIGTVSTGLDVQGDDDIVNSSQSPLKPITEGDEADPDSLSKRMNFPSLTPPESKTFASPDKPTGATESTGTQPFQVSPIIPNKFSSAAEQGSPEGACVRPAWPNQSGSPEGSMPHLYSPNASPSSSILKKRDGINYSSTPSPTSKNRRVSFADKVFIEPEPLRDNSSGVEESSEKSATDSLPPVDPSRVPLPPSPLVTMASSRVVARTSKYITTPSKGSPNTQGSLSSSSLQRLRKKSPHSTRRMKTKQVKPNFMKSSYASKVFSMAQGQGQGQDSVRQSPSQTSTQGSLTQGNVTSQEESSLEGEESQGSVFPALTECELPVDNVLPRLTSSMWSRGLGQLVRARNIRTIGDLSSLSPMQVKSLPIKSPKVSHLKKVLLSFQAEKFPDMKENQSPVGKTTQSSEEADSITPPGSPPSAKTLEDAAKTTEVTTTPRSPQQAPGSDLVKRLSALVSEFKEGALDSVPAVELFQAHAHVNNLMDAIVGALKGKCHSPSMDNNAS